MLTTSTVNGVGCSQSLCELQSRILEVDRYDSVDMDGCSRKYRSHADGACTENYKRRKFWMLGVEG